MSSVLLVRFLQRLSTENVTIELKNNSIIVGTVVSVDFSMNLHLRHVKCTDSSKKVQRLDTLTVRGSTIRYILLPDTINLDTLLVPDEPTTAEGKRLAAAGGDRKRRKVRSTA